MNNILQAALSYYFYSLIVQSSNLVQGSLALAKNFILSKLKVYVGEG